MCAVAGACGRAPDVGQEAAAAPRSDTAVVLLVTLEDPASGVGIIEVRGNGQVVFYRTGIGENREARLEPAELARLMAELRPDLCSLASDSTAGLVTRLTIEPRWSDLSCTIRRPEAAWRADRAGGGIRRAIDGLERRVCGGLCPVNVAR